MHTNEFIAKFQFPFFSDKHRERRVANTVLLCCADDERGAAMSLLGGAAQLRAMAEHDARAMEAATRAMEELVSKRCMEEAASRAAALARGTTTPGSAPTPGMHACVHAASRKVKLAHTRLPSIGFRS